MGYLGRITEEQVERLLSGRGPDAGRDPELEELRSFVVALRATALVQPDRGEVEASLLRRLADTARSARDRAAAAPTAALSAAGPARALPWSRRLGLAARVAVAVALLPAVIAGLAYAGVTLPEPAREAMERIGLELPNQPQGEDGTAGRGGGVDGVERPARQGAPATAEPAAAGGAAKPATSSAGGDRGVGGGDPTRARGDGKDEQKATPDGSGQPAVPPGQAKPKPAKPPKPPSPPTVPPGQAKPKPAKAPKPAKPDKAANPANEHPQAGGGADKK
jgi:hypothetical protein